MALFVGVALEVVALREALALLEVVALREAPERGMGAQASVAAHTAKSALFCIETAA